MRRLLFFVVLALVLTPSASAMHWLQSTDITVEATDSSGADVTYTADPGTTCTPASPFHLAVDAIQTVNCTNDSDSSPAGSFNARVVDTTPPAFTSPASNTTGSTATSSTANVSYTAPTAQDLVDGSVTVNCSPASGSAFPIGTTQVDCSATDAHTNPASTSFNVVVSDTGNPTISLTAPGPTEATGPGGANVNYAVNAADNSGFAPAVDCGSHPSGSTFPLGLTSVSCTATDGAGNHASDGATITVQDTTKPVLSLPANITAEADSSSGKVVSYSASANDLVAGAVAANCAPASGSSFAVGTTTVTCSANDGHGNTANGSFTVTITDSSGPVITGLENREVEANSPTGSIVNYPTPTAIDAVDGPELVSCSPGSGTEFPVGTTVVNCSATDNHGNSSAPASFWVSVVDTTPPAIYLPTGSNVIATSAAGIAASDPSAQTYFQAARAVDLIDPHPVVTYEAPALLLVGANLVTFHARDWAGNESVKTTTLTVLPMGSTTPTPVPTQPPAEVTGVTVTPLDGAVRIRWKANGRLVEVIRSTSSTRLLSALVDDQVVYKGTASSYVDRGVTNGVEYRYVVRAVDAAGNHSAGVAAVVVPRRDLLTTPKDGARLKKAPKLAWRINAEAQYYNAQLLLNGVKVLSVWPVHPSYTLKKSWKYKGHKYTLKPGLYTWYVWPGYGQRSAVNYGSLMGSRTFQIVR